jgi:organic hydroperoxide reductase OsmC/OhrA
MPSPASRLTLRLMPSTRTYSFPVEVGWAGGRLTRVSLAGKQELQVATPREFEGGIPGVWSPEDLFVTATATCYLVTLVGVAERRGVPLRALGVRAAGEVTQRRDGRFGFVYIDLDVMLETDPGCETDARSAAEEAERSCLVAASLDTPVLVALDVRAVAAA